MSMANGVIGDHGRLVLKAVVVDKKKEPEDVTILLLMETELTVLGTTRRQGSAMLSLAVR